jgi:hypothetical protein
VQEQILPGRARGKRAAVERDAILLGIRLGARLEPDSTVDGDAPFREQPFSCSP